MNRSISSMFAQPRVCLSFKRQGGSDMSASQVLGNRTQPGTRVGPVPNSIQYNRIWVWSHALITWCIIITQKEMWFSKHDRERELKCWEKLGGKKEVKSDGTDGLFGLTKFWIGCNYLWAYFGPVRTVLGSHSGLSFLISAHWFQ